MYLVDTSVWIDHLRTANPKLIKALDLGIVASHPYIIGELALGSLKNRSSIIRSLQTLPSATIARDKDVHTLIEERKIYGRGIGYIDCHLLASILIEGTLTLWTHDKRLDQIADEFRFK